MKVDKIHSFKKGYKIISLKINIFTLVIRPCQRQKEENSEKNVKIDDLLYSEKIRTIPIFNFHFFSHLISFSKTIEVKFM